MRLGAALWLGAIVMLSGAPALALPRFAAQNSLRCLQCHVNPSGGGVRNRYGADVFALGRLPMTGEEATEVDLDEDESASIPFSGAITEWLSVGADLRAAYFLAAPAESLDERSEARISTTFFLMQADLYHAAELGEHVTLVLDIGVNSGFEAWALLRPWPELRFADVMLKAGRFLPASGLRTDNHSLFTRERVGLGPSAQDTGLELTVDGAYAALTLGITNGTLGSPFDDFAVPARTFDKAVLARGSVRLRPGPLAVELGGSAYLNRTTITPNPLFSIATSDGAAGVDELRAGGFVVMGLGRLALLGDFVWVRDDFRDDARPSLTGYAAYGELSVHLARGLDLLGGYERLDAGPTGPGLTQRASVAVELFPLAFTEVRALVRHQFGPGTPGGSITDLVAFLHVFL